MAIIALVEISLRNLANARIAADLGQPDWLQIQTLGLQFDEQEERAIKTAIKHAQKAEYSKLTYAEKKKLDTTIYPHGVPSNIKHDTLSKKRWETFMVSQGVVAQS